MRAPRPSRRPATAAREARGNGTPSAPRRGLFEQASPSTRSTRRRRNFQGQTGVPPRIKPRGNRGRALCESSKMFNKGFDDFGVKIKRISMIFMDFPYPKCPHLNIGGWGWKSETFITFVNYFNY